MRGWMALAVPVVALLVVASCGRAAPAAAPAAPSTSPTIPEASAMAVAPDLRVGAVFLGAGSLHTCTGSVLNSGGGDLILTAAHCMVEGTDATFVAGFQDGAAPQDVWHLDAVYLDPRWVRSQDPVADFAIARVSRAAGGSVQAQAGGGLALGSAPRPGSTVTVTGYGLGVGGGPIACHALTAAVEHGFPALPCAGLVDGLSGAPWISGSTVQGLIGGLDGGGCDENMSYSPPFDGEIARLLARAEQGGPGDRAPSVSDSDC